MMTNWHFRQNLLQLWTTYALRRGLEVSPQYSQICGSYVFRWLFGPLSRPKFQLLLSECYLPLRTSEVSRSTCGHRSRTAVVNIWQCWFMICVILIPHGVDGGGGSGAIVIFLWRVQSRSLLRPYCGFGELLKPIRRMKNGVFWDVTLCGSCKNRRFGGT
jgi:hypothetical protein